MDKFLLQQYGFAIEFWNRDRRERSPQRNSPRLTLEESRAWKFLKISKP